MADADTQRKQSKHGPSVHNKELNVFYSLPYIVLLIETRRMKMAGHVARMALRTVMDSVLVGKTEGDHLGYTGVDGSIYIYIYLFIEMNLQEVGRGSMEWIELFEDGSRWREIVNGVMNFRVHQCKEFY